MKTRRIAALLIIALGFSGNAFAQSAGCYVSSFERSSFGSCGCAGSGAVGCTGTYFSDAQFYGTAVAKLCSQMYELVDGWKQGADLCAVGLSQCNTGLVEKNDIIGRNIDALNKQGALIKKLRRKCGRACASVK